MSFELPISLERRADSAQTWVADEAALLERAARLSRDDRLGHALREALMKESHHLLFVERPESSYES